MSPALLRRTCCAAAAAATVLLPPATLATPRAVAAASTFAVTGFGRALACMPVAAETLRGRAGAAAAAAPRHLASSSVGGASAPKQAISAFEQQQQRSTATSAGGAGATGRLLGGFGVGAAAGSGGAFGPFWDSTKIFGIANALGLGISLATGSHVHLDLIGTGAFAVAAAFSLLAAARGPTADLRLQLSAGIIIAWAVRLAGFLFYRAIKLGHDARLDETLSSAGGMVAFWTVSFLWSVFTSLPHTLSAGCGLGAAGSGGAKAARPALGWLAAVALVICAWGLYWEVAADMQKWFFKADPANRGKLCTVGLWGLSQHPNYFGNIMLWTGIFLLNAAPLAAAGWPKLLLAGLSPLFLAGLFYGQASGAITNAAELAAQKYASDPAFAEYLRKTPLVVPSRPF